MLLSRKRLAGIDLYEIDCRRRLRLFRSHKRSMLSGIIRVLSERLRLGSLVAAHCVVVAGGPVLRAEAAFPLTQQLQQMAGCEVHILQEGGTAYVGKCGAPLPATKRAVGWVQTNTRITPFLVDVAGGDPVGVDHLVPSGVVAFPADRELRRGERLLLVSLVPPAAGLFIRKMFVREISSLGITAALPAGRAAIVLMKSNGRPEAASVFTVRPGARAVIWPELPKSRDSVLIAWLSRPRLVNRDDEDRVDLRAEDQAGVHRPLALVNGADALFAIWTSLSGSTRLLVDSQKLRLARDSVEMIEGMATAVVEPLAVLPTLNVAVGTLPADVPEPIPPMMLTVRSSNGEPGANRGLPVQSGERYAIESLPAVVLALQLRINDFVIERHVDLTSGSDATVEIPLVPLTVSGTVYRGTIPTRGFLRFLQGSDALRVETDYAGSYSVTLWQPGRYIVETIAADRPGMAALAQDFAIAVSRTIDIHLPENSLSARVYDSANGRPIDDTRITVHSRWTDASGTSSRIVTLAGSGELTELPPMRTGTASITASAPGYAGPDPIVVVVSGGPDVRVIDVPMTKQSSMGHVQLRLANLAPAAGAEATLWLDDSIVWRGVADDQGRLALRGKILGRLIVRHRDAASAVILSLEPEVTLHLEAPAPPALIRMASQSEAPSGSTGGRLSVWLAGGVRLSGPEAAFATWSSELPTPDGFFVLRGLGRRPLRVLATRRASAAQIRTGRFDALATTVSYPWAPVTVVRFSDP